MRTIEFLIAALMVVVCVLFLISVFAPRYSDKPFWRFIITFRNGLDFVCYWIFTGGLIFTVIAAAVYFGWKFLH